ncbi:MAG: YitT family protein [Flavipsychrobacter sp.]
MKEFLNKIIIRSVLREQTVPYTSFQLAKGFRKLRLSILELLKDIVLILVGVSSAAIGLKSFLLPARFIDGGVTGISLLSSLLTNIDLPIFLLAINLPFIILAFKVVSKEFAIKTACAVALLALATATIHFPEITHDKLLVAIFGGFFIGAGIGLSVRGGAVLDGTEVLAIFLSRKVGSSIGDIIIVINIVIFSAAAYFISMEAAMYSMVTYLAASKTLDFVVEGVEEYTGVTIISPHHEEIRMMVINHIGRGVTVYKGKTGFGRHGHNKDVDIVYTVVTRLEVNRLNTEIEKIDPNAFVVMTRVKDTKGGMVKKRPLKH